MAHRPLFAALDPLGGDPAADASSDPVPTGQRDDVGGAPAPRRRWQMRTSDKIGMGTFSVASVSAYLLWNMIQGIDDVRQGLRDVADAQRINSVTLERVGYVAEHQERYAAHELQTLARFGDFEGRLVAARRSMEDMGREQRDQEQRLRVLETAAAPPRRAPQE